MRRYRHAEAGQKPAELEAAALSATRPRLPAAERRVALLDTACRVFAKSSYRGVDHGGDRPRDGRHRAVLYRHFGSKRGLYLACLDAVWLRVRVLWEQAIEHEPDPAQLAVARSARRTSRPRRGEVVLVDLWVQALTEAADDPEIRRALRDAASRGARVRRRRDPPGPGRRAGIVAERDADAEAWIFISLGLLSTIDRRLGNLVGEEFEGIVASRRAWMTGAYGRSAPKKKSPRLRLPGLLVFAPL